MKKLDRNLLISAVIGILLSLGVIIYLSGKPSLLPLTRRAQETPVATQGPAVLTVSTASVDASTVGVYLTPMKNNTLSAFSLRLTLPYSAGMNYQGMSFTPNSTLIANGWLFPIKQITYNEATKQIFIDISGVMTDPAGYSFKEKVEIGTIDTASLGGNTTLTIGIDRSQTKILAKDASQLNYNFQ